MIKNIVIALITAAFGLISVGGTMWANAMYEKVESIDNALIDKGERITKLETKFDYIVISLTEIKEAIKVKHGQKITR